MTGGEAETAIQAALDSSALNNCYVLLERRDGYQFTATKGSPNNRYISSSTVKPVSCAAILDAIARYNLHLSTRAVDVVPEFDALATGQQRHIELRHLLSFTSGLFTNVSPTPCASSANNWGEFVTCVAGLASINNDSTVPGASHTYATDQHALAGIMAVNAAGADDWASYLQNWVNRSGMFPGLTWNLSLIHGANVLVNITAAEYVAFFKALRDETILTPALCRDMYADAIPNNPARTTTHTSWGIGEDWHFGRGIWLEERNDDWVGTPPPERFSTIGNAGQYAYFDKRTGVIACISALFTADFTDGFSFLRGLDSEIAAWARDRPASRHATRAASLAAVASEMPSQSFSTVAGSAS